MFLAFNALYKNTLRHFSHAKYNSAADVRHVATKLLKIVGNFWNFIICVIMVFCVDDAAYSNGCAFETNFVVNYYVFSE